MSDFQTQQASLSQSQALAAAIQRAKQVRRSSRTAETEKKPSEATEKITIVIRADCREDSTKSAAAITRRRRRRQRWLLSWRRRK